MMEPFIKITDQPIDASKVADLVKTAGSGAVNVFIGTVRNSTKNRQVIRLEFEAYERMALKEIAKIVERAKEKFEINEISIYHRVGVLDIGEVPVVIAVSTDHRQEGFAACEYAIDTLKETVPIWKKEFFADGEEWVSAHP